MTVEKRRVKNDIEYSILIKNELVTRVTISSSASDYTMRRNAEHLAKKYNLNKYKLYKEMIK